MDITFPDPLTHDPLKRIGNEELLERFVWLVDFMQQNHQIRPTLDDLSTGWGRAKPSVSIGLSELEVRGWIEFLRHDKRGNRLNSSIVITPEGHTTWVNYKVAKDSND